jgi:GNAT superfamily N-acetyltransferase
MSVELIQQAQVLGYRTVRLDTLRRLEPAVKLYGELGFVEIPAYNFNPEDDIAYFELPLT